MLKPFYDPRKFNSANCNCKIVQLVNHIFLYCWNVRMLVSNTPNLKKKINANYCYEYSASVQK